MGGRVGVIDTAIKSVSYDTTIVILENGEIKYVQIGEWIDKHLPGTHLVLRSAKHKYELSGHNHILIDDKITTIESWIEAGGIGILHTSTAETIEHLKLLNL